MAEAHKLQQISCLKDFQCLGDACPDTCCKGWGMQLTKETVALYEKKAPELLEAVTSGESEHIMKRDAITDYCIKFDNGWCGIHADYGTEFLGDACHFFPRSTRSLGDVTIMTAAMSCPEIVRLALYTENNASIFHETSVERLPYSLKDYLPEDLTAEQAFQIHHACLKAVMEEDVTAERSLMRLRNVVMSLEMLPKESWVAAIDFYIKQADIRIPPAEPHAADDFNLLNIYCTLLALSKPTARPRLEQTIQDIERALYAQYDKTGMTVRISEQSADAHAAMKQKWLQHYADHFQPLMQRWLQMQLSLTLFPFTGQGKGMSDYITIIAVRFAMTRLALMSLCNLHKAVPSQEEIIRVMQSLARFQDHLADATTLLSLCEQVGWTKESRLGGLLFIAR